jgi:hypothetical protein
MGRDAPLCLGDLRGRVARSIIAKDSPYEMAWQGSEHLGTVSTPPSGLRGDSVRAALKGVT